MSSNNSAHRLMHTYGGYGITIVRGEGSYLYDSTGKRYMDFLSGIAVMSLGHSAPAVRRALDSASQTLQHVSNFFDNTSAIALAQELNRLIDSGSGQVFFCNSGAEANEAAIKLARKFGGGERYEIISALNSFHGRTLGALAATGQVAKQVAFRPLPGGFTAVPYNDLSALREATQNQSVAAVILEPILGEGGVVDPSPGYLRAARELTSEAEVLLIVDEVQTGMCRTGDWFAFQSEGIAPDMVTMAKALGNGFPIGALWARDEIASAFVPGDHGTTFGGSPMATSVALSVVGEMESLGLDKAAREKGEYLVKRLSDLSGIGSVSGRGLLLGAHLSRPVAKAYVAKALERGLILNALNDEVVRIAPPLTISYSEMDEALATMGSLMGDKL